MKCKLSHSYNDVTFSITLKNQLYENQLMKRTCFADNIETLSNNESREFREREHNDAGETF